MVVMARFRPGDSLFCATHRGTIWLGHLICALDVGGCGAIYRNALTCPLICDDCDRRLLGQDRVPKSEDNRQFTGRAICPLCYQVESRSAAPKADDVITD